MCKFWRKEKCNHHFPELNRRRGLFSLFSWFSNWQRLSYFMVALSFIFGLAYLLQTNYTATKGYVIKDLERQVAELQNENKKAKLTYVSLQSMSNVVSKVPKLNLVASNGVEIINYSDQVVALRK